MNKEAITAALKAVKYPGFSRDIVSFGLVRDVTVEGEVARISLAVTTSNPAVAPKLKAEVEAAVGRLEGISEVDVAIAVKAARAPTQSSVSTEEGKNKISEIRYTIAIASGKGGVGKSTFAVNLACALENILAKRGKPHRTGIMDCDVHGPSIPLMIGINGRPAIDDNMILPLENFGIRVMSMGFLVDEETPVVWRGPMVTKTIMQFVQNVKWGPLEILVVDLPPGTGDAQLALVQTIALDGAIVVTTPQLAAVKVARRGAMMFEKVNVSLLGVAENMSYLEDPGLGKRVYLFGRGGGQKTADDLKTQLLGQVPLDPEICEGSDKGIPIVISSPHSIAAQVFKKIAEKILDRFNLEDG